jgi:hypothetical protein
MEENSQDRQKTARRLRAIAAIERRFGFVRKQTSSDSAF